MVRLRDETGAGNPIEFALLLPLFLALFIGAYQVWEVSAIKESLDRGVLMASEYWSTCLPEGGDQSANCAQIAEAIIWQELGNNSIIQARAQAGEITVIDLSVSYFQQSPDQGSATPFPSGNPADWPVFLPFVIQARLSVPFAIQIPFRSPLRMTLVSEHITFKERPFRRPPTPTPALHSWGNEWDQSPTPPPWWK